MRSRNQKKGWEREEATRACLEKNEGADSRKKKAAVRGAPSVSFRTAGFQ